MDKKSIVVSVAQLVLISLVWMLNPSAMTEQIYKLLFVFGVGCTVGVTAPIMFTPRVDIRIYILGIIFEVLYIAALGILWGAVQYNIVI